MNVRRMPCEHEAAADRTRQRIFTERLFAGGVVAVAARQGEKGNSFAAKAMRLCSPDWLIDGNSRNILRAVERVLESGIPLDLLSLAEAVKALSNGGNMIVRPTDFVSIVKESAEFVLPANVLAAGRSIADEWRKEQAAMELSRAMEVVKTPGTPAVFGLDSVSRAASLLSETAASSQNRYRAWLDGTSGVFALAEMYRDLGVKTQEDRDRCQREIADMLSSGAIEQAGDRSGRYRRKDRKLEAVDLESAEQPKIDMWLPFGLHRDVIIQPKNIVIVAGETNSGKTGLLFNFCAMNKDRFPIRYLTSEMTGGEIKGRIAAFDNAMEKWDTVHFFERAACFHDAIDPDGINIIDFLEVHENFYAIGGEIKKIFDALKSGVVFIAIQKRTGELYGRGGEFTLEKARLGLSLFTHGRLPDGIIGSAKVTKAKNFVPGRNPDGKEQFYTLTRGVRYDNSPINMINFQRGWRFYPKKERDKIAAEIERHCKRVTDTQMADEIENFYGNLF